MRNRKKELILLVFFALTVLVLSGAGQPHTFSSVEVKFTDGSRGGLSIMPASCPSNPHYQGDCTINPPPVPGTCNITAQNDTLAEGGSTTLSWATGNYQWGAISISPSNGFISPGIGPVDATQGALLVQPQQTTTYTLSGRYIVGGVPVGGTFSCSHTIYILQCPTGYTAENGRCVFTTCPPGHTLVNGVCVFTGGSCTAGFICDGNYSVYQAANCALSQWQLCAYGCAAGACYVPSPEIVTWNVRPVLVRSGSPVQVTWAAQHVRVCSVTGTNGDGTGSNSTGTWDQLNGDHPSSPITSQTIFTITCQGYPGSTPASVTQSTTVNIAPIFQEQ